MKGVFVNWTKPYTDRNRLRGEAFKFQREQSSDDYTTTDEELLYTILSVGFWKKFNGPTKLYTDKVGLAYYLKNNLIDLWDEIDTHTLENYKDIDSAQFWTSGKCYCIGQEQIPFCFMDLDFMIMQKLPEWVFNTGLAISHWEIPRGKYFPNKEEYDKIKHWQPPANYAYKMLMANTSFLYFGNKEVQAEYLKDHLAAVNTKDEIPEWFWLVTDQGLLGQVLRRLNVQTQTLTDKVFLSDYEGYEGKVGEAQGYYYSMNHDYSKDDLKWYHVWVRKSLHHQDEEVRVSDCKLFYNLVVNELPMYKHLLNNPRLERYK